MRISPLLVLILVVVVPLLLVGLLLTAGNFELIAWRSPLIWTDQFGNGNETTVTGVATDGSGVYAGGYPGNGTAGLSAVFFLKRFDDSGRMIWNQSLKSVFPVLLSEVSVGGGGVYVAANTRDATVQTYFRHPTLFKYDLNGNQVWTREYDGGQGAALPVISATSDGVFLAGGSGTPLTNQSLTGGVLFIRGYDSSGNVVWTSEFSNSTKQSIKGVSACSSGVYIVTTSTYTGENSLLVKYDLNGNESWSMDIGGDGEGVACDGFSSYVLGGPIFPHASIGIDFLTKYRVDGSTEWSVTISSPDHSGVGPAYVSADSSGAYLAFTSAGYGNRYLMKYTIQGGQEWSFRDPSPWNDLNGISVGSGLLVLGGTSGAYGTFAFLQGFSKDGSLIFFGLNPPWSFIAVGSLGAVLGTAVVWYLRRRKRRLALGIKRGEPRLPARIPADIVPSQ